MKRKCSNCKKKCSTKNCFGCTINKNEKNNHQYKFDICGDCKNENIGVCIRCSK